MLDGDGDIGSKEELVDAHQTKSTETHKSPFVRRLDSSRSKSRLKTSDVKSGCRLDPKAQGRVMTTDDVRRGTVRSAGSTTTSQ